MSTPFLVPTGLVTPAVNVVYVTGTLNTNNAAAAGLTITLTSQLAPSKGPVFTGVLDKNGAVPFSNLAQGVYTVALTGNSGSQTVGSKTISLNSSTLTLAAGVNSIATTTNVLAQVTPEQISVIASSALPAGARLTLIQPPPTAVNASSNFEPPDNQVATFSHISTGTYQASLTNAPGWTLANPNLEITSDTVTLSVVADPSTTAQNNQDSAAGTKPGAPVGVTASDSDIDAIDFALVNAGLLEATADNSAYVGYFTGTQCRLYIGSLFIDELVMLSFVLQANNVPIYGYCSDLYDAIGRGRSIVQGQITINYVHQGYMYAAIQNISRKQPAAFDNTQAQAAQIAATLKTQQKPGQSAATKQAVQASLNSLLLASTPQTVQQAKKMLNAGSQPANLYANPTYLQQTFDMRVEIGVGNYRTVRMLEACKLGGNEQIIDNSGQTIAESYSFIARRLR